MTPEFDTRTNDAFRKLGALGPGQHWSSFDVTGKQARQGLAARLVTTIWNSNWKWQGTRRVRTTPGIYRDHSSGGYWYRIGGPNDRLKPNRVAHWTRFVLARENQVPVVGILKDYVTSRCSLEDLFDGLGILEDGRGEDLWLKLSPRRPVTIETEPIDMRRHVGTGALSVNSEPAKTVEDAIRHTVTKTGQGWLADAERRRAVEAYAMSLAKSHYTQTWTRVEDVSTRESFDLRCTDGNRQLRVEVKGTTTRGGSVLLTRNEVLHAENAANRVALFVVSNIKVDSENRCSGGEQRVFEPWKLDPKRLTPLAFEYLLP